jgi:hypothetical protein
MGNLPSRGWGPWRREFYSLHSDPQSIQMDTAHEFGTWRNVWGGLVSHFVYTRWPSVWQWMVNIPYFHRRRVRRLRKFFPNL